MQRLHVLLIGFVTVLAAAVAGVADVNPAPLSVRGRVIDASDQPVPGAAVVVLGARTDAIVGMRIEKIAEAQAAADGMFEATAADASGCERVLVAARQKGHAIGSWNGAVSELPATLTLGMGEPTTIAGVVVDASGQPIAGTTVKAMLRWQADGNSHSLLGHGSIPELMVKTDLQGRFEITGVPEGALACLAVAADGYASMVWPAVTPSVPAGSKDLSITLTPGASVSGTVRCADAEQSLEGLPVVALFGDLSYLTDCRAETDAAGRFTLSGLPAGEVRVVVPPTEAIETVADVRAEALPWIGEAQTLVVGPGRASEDLSIELRRASAIEISVLTRNNNAPVADAQVYVSDQRNNHRLAMQTDAKGIARALVLPGDYLVGAQHPDYAQNRARQYCSAGPGESQDVVVWLNQAAVLNGVVLDDASQPVAGAQVQVVPSNGQDVTTTDAEGGFRMKWEPVEWGNEITSMLVMRHPSTDRAVAVPIEDPTQPLAVKLQKAAAFSGRVLTEEGEPLAGANVMVSMQGDGWGSSLRESSPITTDAEGKFRISALPAEVDYYLTATVKGYGQHAWRIEFANPSETVLDDAKLLKADQTLSGVVVDTDGKPVAGANVQVYGDEQPHQSVQSDAEGEFKIEGLCAGYTNLYANTQGSPHRYGQMYAKVGRSDVKLVVSSDGSYGEPTPEPVPQPMKDRPLPDLTTLGLAAAPAGKPVLMLFIDARQRPSRHALEQLQAKAGASTSAHVVVVQLGPVDDTALDALKVTLPLARVQDAADRVCLDWGVPGLPWYILADPSGKIVHSGPSLTPAP